MEYFLRRSHLHFSAKELHDFEMSISRRGLQRCPSSYCLLVNIRPGVEDDVELSKCPFLA